MFAHIFRLLIFCGCFCFIVQIRRKEICIYPDETKKPPVGEGLNKEAEITLHRVWPVDKHTNRPIADTSQLMAIRYAKKIEKQTIEMGAEFVDYDYTTGSWTFRVKHFSIYGLKDDDSDEDDDNDDDDSQNNMTKDMLKKQLQLIKQRRLELARKKLAATTAKSTATTGSTISANAMFFDNISEDNTVASTASRKSSIDDGQQATHQQQQQMYPDLRPFEAISKTRKLYPNLNNLGIFDD